MMRITIFVAFLFQLLPARGRVISVFGCGIFIYGRSISVLIPSNGYGSGVIIPCACCVPVSLSATGNYGFVAGRCVSRSCG